jgi:hypothetical protein
MRPLIAGLLFISLVSCQKHRSDADSDACNGDTRREVKLMTDALAASVDTVPVSISLKDFGDLSVPEVSTETGRQEIEKKVYSVTATVDKVKIEQDGDYHIRLKDGDAYLITECPNPNCSYAEGSPYAETYRHIRELIRSNELEGKVVTVTGVAFIDIDHHYKRKEAKNRMELHPILEVEF